MPAKGHSEHKLKYRKLKPKKISFYCQVKHWSRMSRQAMQFLPVQIIKTQLDTAPSNLP